MGVVLLFASVDYLILIETPKNNQIIKEQIKHVFESSDSHSAVL